MSQAHRNRHAAEGAPTPISGPELTEWDATSCPNDQRTSDSFLLPLLLTSGCFSIFPPLHGALSQCGGLYLTFHIQLRNQASGIPLPLL